jgi:hypothetical protein
MKIPQGRTRLNFAAPAEAAGRSFGTKILHRGIFSRRLLATALLSCAVFWTDGLAAQEELPQIIPGERKIPTKKDNGPRALALLRVTGNGKASLVPIAIMINGKFWDASAYKADPVPMALEFGTVYEVERAGSSQGLFTVGGALHSNAVNSQAPWIATGSWVPWGSEKPSKDQKAESAPVGIDTIDAPPRLTRNSAPPSGTTPSGTTPGSTTPNSSPDSKPSSGDEPPRLSKPASPPASAPSSSSPTDAKDKSGSGQPGPSTSTPNSSGSIQSGSASAQEKKSGQSSIPASDSDTPETDRPILRRGKPAQSFADEGVPGYSKPGEAPAASSIKTSAKNPGATDTAAQLIPAVSDAHGPDPRSFVFPLQKDEEAQRQQQMLDLAKQQVQAYVKAHNKESIAPPSQVHRAAQHAANKKLADPIFENVKMAVYDVWVTNQPILILSADAHMPPAENAQGSRFSDLQYSITLVAYPDIYNNLHKLYSGITDRYHLDVTPRLELVDAVDADGDGRGELLFRETSDAGTGWIIYRPTADTLWKMYDSLNPE